MKVKRLGIVVWVTLLALAVSSAARAAETVDHSPLDAILKAAVKDERVDYDAIKKDHLQQLNAYLDTLAKVDPSKLDKNEQLAYDINLYKADLTLAGIDQELRQAASRYGLPREEFDELYSRVCDRPLGHLSGGLARDGADFLTVYYETQPLPG